MRSLWSRLTVWYAVALTATVLAFGLVVYLVRRHAGFAELERRLTAEARLGGALLAQAAEHGEVVIVEGRGALAASLPERVARQLEPIPDYLVVVDSAARRVFGSAAVAGLSPEAADSLTNRAYVVSDSLETFTLALDRRRVRFVARRMHEAVPALIAVAVGAPTGDVEIALGQLLSSLLAIAPLILLASSLVGYLLARRALRPVSAIIDELEAISDGRSLHRRLPASAMAPDEVGRLATTLNAMIARLEASFAALRRFTADASHELKTPLTVLRAGVERAITHPDTPAETLVPLEETLQEVNRMTEMVDALLTLARADEGRAELHREPVDLAALMAEVHETAQLLGEQAGLEVTLQVPEEPIVVEGDRGRLRQLLLNLASNAIKYTGPEGQVALTLTGSAQAATIQVRDTGIGIAPGDVGRVFDRFWRADPARSRTGQRPGVGLGLAIGKWIVEVHGGTIGLTSRPGRGTTFTVTLPRSPTPHPAAIES